MITQRLAITPGARLGVYEVTADRRRRHGSVDRACDTNLDRDVAITPSTWRLRE